jgi:tRNA (Thr-GGU) A37 N-methylase
MNPLAICDISNEIVFQLIGIVHTSHRLAEHTPVQPVYARGCRVLDGTPLLDSKPFIPRFERIENASGGWTEAVDDATARYRGQRKFPTDAK